MSVDSIHRHTHTHTHTKKKKQGGGALYVLTIDAGNTVNIGGTWSDNRHKFQHGLGAGIHVEWNEGVCACVDVCSVGVGGIYVCVCACVCVCGVCRCVVCAW